MLNCEKIEKLILITFLLGMCLQRLAMGPSSVLMGISIAGFLYYAYKNKNVVMKTYRTRGVEFYVWAYILFACSLIPSLFGTDRLGVSIHSYLNIVVYHVMPFVMVIFMPWNKRILTWMVIIFLALEALESAVAIYQTVVKYSGPETRGNGFTVKGLFMPGMLAYTVPLCGIVAISNYFGKKLRTCATCCLPLFVGAVFAANSRAGILIFLLQLCIMCIIYFRNVGKSWMKMAAVIAIVICGFGVFMCNSRIRSSADFSGRNGSNYARILLWKSSFNMMKDFPLTGVGLGNWRKAYREQGYITQEIQYINGGLNHAHSSYMHLGGETGWPGFLGLIGFHLAVLLYSLIKWWRSNNICYGIVFAMWLGEGIFGFIEPIFIQTDQSRFLMWMTGVMLSLCRLTSD